MGRSSEFTPEKGALICNRIADGESLRAICRDEGMPDKATVLRWLAANEHFRDQYARAREAQADHFADEILEISDDATNDYMMRKRGDDVETVVDHEHISRSKLRVDARRWLMSKMAPKKYGDRQEVNLKVTDGLSDAELDSRIKHLSTALGIEAGTGGTVGGEAETDETE